MRQFKNIAIALLGIIPCLVNAQVMDTAKRQNYSGNNTLPVPSGIKDTLKSAAISIPATPFPDTNIHVYEQAVVKNTNQKIYDYQHYNHETSPGFRVQIDFSQERNGVNKTKADFNTKYPSIPAYIAYKQPYFKVSVGDFRTRLEATRCLNTLKRDYPAAFITADRITLPPL